MKTSDGIEILASGIEWSGTVELFMFWPGEPIPEFVQMTPDQAQALASELLAAAVNAEKKRAICTRAYATTVTGRELVRGMRPEFADWDEYGYANELGSIDAVRTIPAGSAVVSDDGHSVHTSGVAR